MRPRRPGHFTSVAITLVLAAGIMAPHPAAGAQAQSGAQAKLSDQDRDGKLAPELEALAASANSAETVRVIVQTGASAEEFDQAIAEKGGHVFRSLPLIHGYVAELPIGALRDVGAAGATEWISLDRPTALQGDSYDYNLLQATTGAQNILGKRSLSMTSAGGQAVGDYIQSLPNGPNGSGVTIAVLDSGIYDYDQEHQDLKRLGDPSSSRVLAHLNFVGKEKPSDEQLRQGYDPYGHGTHVAGIAAGSGRKSLTSLTSVENVYGGLAVNANLIDLRVIGADGRGSISDSIAAINWLLLNRSKYNIRVANLSIGAAVTQSFKRDPLCQAVEKAVRAGIVCVASAGNFGKDASGNPVYGSILAPANDPLVITVGAVNSWGTTVRSDDTIASYSSRGPTLIDNVSKPDLVAPGTLIRSIASNRNYLTRTNNLTVYACDGEDVYMWLSGTSMSAPVVSGAAALMLDANPGLTPAMVKSILQFTAQPLSSLSAVNPLLQLETQGAGSINVDGAVRLAEAFSTSAGDAALGAQLLIQDPAKLSALLYSTQDRNTKEFVSIIGGESVPWGARVLFSEGVAYLHEANGALSAVLASGWQSAGLAFSDGFLLSEGGLITSGVMLDQSKLLTSGVMLDQSILTPSGGIFLATAWLVMTGTHSLTNPSAARASWSANLLDQSLISSGTIFDQRSAELVMSKGDDAPGRDILKISDPSHPLMPHIKKIKGQKEN